MSYSMYIKIIILLLYLLSIKTQTWYDEINGHDRLIIFLDMQGLQILEFMIFIYAQIENIESII